MGVVSRIKSELVKKNANNNIFSLHCIVHQENLCEKSLKFTHVMDTVVSCVNYIKSRGLNHRQFQQFLQDLETDYGDIIFFVKSAGSVKAQC